MQIFSFRCLFFTPLFRPHWTNGCWIRFVSSYNTRTIGLSFLRCTNKAILNRNINFFCFAPLLSPDILDHLIQYHSLAFTHNRLTDLLHSFSRPLLQLSRLVFVRRHSMRQTVLFDVARIKWAWLWCKQALHVRWKIDVAWMPCEPSGLAARYKEPSIFCDQRSPILNCDKLWTALSGECLYISRHCMWTVRKSYAHTYWPIGKL